MGDGNERDEISHLGLADAVYERVVELILDGSIEPGAPLRIARIASHTGVSHTPVREALARLEATGLVKRLPLRGYIVAPPLTPQELENLTEVRALLEPEIVARACRAGSPTLVERLQETQELARRAPAGTLYHEYQEYLSASSSFHSILSEECGNPYLASAISNLPVHVQRFRLFGTEGVTDAAVSIAEHQRILDAIVAGDVQAARKAMYEHVHAVHQRAIPEGAAQPLSDAHL